MTLLEIVLAVLAAPIVALVTYGMFAAVSLLLFALEDKFKKNTPPYCDIDPRCNPRFILVTPTSGLINDFVFLFDHNGGHQVLRLNRP